MRNKTQRSVRALTLSAALATSLVLTACVGGGDGPDTASDAGVIPTDHKGTVRLLLEGVPDSDIVKSLIPEFNKVYPDIEIKVETLVYDQMRDKLIASFQAPTPNYDLIVVDNPWYADFSQAGFLEDLDARIGNTPDFDLADYFTPLTDITTVDGTTYGIPFYNYGLGYIYRDDLFDEAGLEVPTTLDELVAVSQELNSADFSGIALMPQRGYKVFEEWGNFLYAAGGSIYDESGQPSLDTPEAEEALEKYIELYKTAAPANSLNWAVDEATRAVASGSSAAMVSYNWSLPPLNSADGQSGDLAGKFKLAPMPGGKSVLGEWGWSIPFNSGDSDAAWAFLSWITSKDVDVERVKAGGSVTRSSTVDRDDVTSLGEGPEYWAAIKHILANSAPLSQGEHGEEMIQAVGTELNAAVAGTKSVEEALAAANAAIKKIQGL